MLNRQQQLGIGECVNVCGTSRSCWRPSATARFRAARWRLGLRRPSAAFGRVLAKRQRTGALQDAGANIGSPSSKATDNRQMLGECVRQTPPHILFDQAPALWCLEYPFDSRLDLARERCSKTGTASLVECRCLPVFETCFRVKGISHRPTVRRTSASTCSPGIGCTRPDRTSSRRRMASAAQSR